MTRPGKQGGTSSEASDYFPSLGEEVWGQDGRQSCMSNNDCVLHSYP